MSSESATILVVDNDADVAWSVARALREAGYAPLVKAEADDIFQVVEREHLDVIVADLCMPTVDGLALLEKLRATHAELSVLVLTGFGCVDFAVKAMRAGATDCLEKPFELDELLFRVERAIARTRPADANTFLRDQGASNQESERIIGRSAAFADLMRLADKLAATDARVLVVGERGTGKKLIARAIHRRSARRAYPYFAERCGALPEHVLESDLFGHERGAFIAAVTAKKGVFEMARGGTLLLEDIGATSLAFQRKLLRVLQLGEFFRVGGRRRLETDVRILSSTTEDLRTAVTEGRFWSELFYRLSVVQIYVPPLRDRADDIPLLAAHFAWVCSRQMQKRVRGISAEAMETLMRHSWPGNIRELENVIQDAVLKVEDGQEILPQHLFV